MRLVVYDDEEGGAPSAQVQRYLDRDPQHDIGALAVSYADMNDAQCHALSEILRAHWHTMTQDPCCLVRRTHAGIRRLDLSSNRITSLERAGIIDMVRDNALLTQLELQANEIVRSRAHKLDECRRFAHAVSTSTLRVLNMTANHLGNEGMAAFFDALPRTGTSLRSLYMSVNTFESGSGSLQAARSIARFLSDPGACRGLERLHLNGNHFGWAGVRMIAHAIMGSRAACTMGGTADATTQDEGVLDASPPNRSLIHIDLFSTGIDSWASMEPQATYASWEPYSLVTRDHWWGLVERQLEENERRRDAARRAATRVLAAARVLGCKVREADPQGAYSFLRLPLELRLRLISYVDSHGILTHEQLVHVLQWASEPGTMGYGIQQRIDTAPATQLRLVRRG
ncbi:hypothetical protein MCAP1_001188 [Malassezia caprae]|uniref:Uncharacterized protein n=1 Tax=Malassezia caprae TaxID=1381934 RepID=A0AAF0E5D7_9BASI|nr:hypothetical protein MCAP1_001188 [Malassezia caprae]